MAQNISYRTVGNTGSLRSPVFDKKTGQNPQQVFAMHAAIKAQRDAKIEQRRQVQAAKDRWRDEQLSGIASTEFVNTVHGSMHEPAKDWLDTKYQRYGEIMDALNSEGMNSSNPQWRELQNEAAGIRSSYENLKKGLEGFRARRVEAIDMRNPENNDNPYNEVAKTPDSENSMGFLVDRELKEGYGDIQIADDGSFTFAGTNWNGKEIGSDNLPTLTIMPTAKAQELNKAAMTHGQNILNGSKKITDDRFLQDVRTEAGMTFKGMSRGELQAYILNDMDGNGGMPAFIIPEEVEADLAEGKDPVFKWVDGYGKEQEMAYTKLMGDKNAMASFATSNYYDGVLTYLKGQVPKESGPGKKQPPTNITSLIKDSIVKSQNEFGEDVGINNKASNKNIALALANSFPSGYGHDEFASREAAFILFKDSWKNNKYAKIDDETIRGLIQMEDTAGGKKISDKHLLQLMKEYDDYGLVMSLYKDFINKFQDKELFLQTKSGSLIAPKINLQDENQVWLMLNQLKMVSKNQAEVMYEMDFTNPGAFDN